MANQQARQVHQLYDYLLGRACRVPGTSIGLNATEIMHHLSNTLLGWTTPPRVFSRNGRCSCGGTSMERGAFLSCFAGVNHLWRGE